MIYLSPQLNEGYIQIVLYSCISYFSHSFGEKSIQQEQHKGKSVSFVYTFKRYSSFYREFTTAESGGSFLPGATPSRGVSFFLVLLEAVEGGGRALVSAG